MACLRCGECCRTFGYNCRLGEGFKEAKHKGLSAVYIPFGLDQDAPFTEHLRARGIDTRDVRVRLPVNQIPENARKVFLRFNYPCQHLTEDNLCAIYESRPQYCRNFLCKKAQVGATGLLQPSGIEVVESKEESS